MDEYEQRERDERHEMAIDDLKDWIESAENEIHHHLQRELSRYDAGYYYGRLELLKELKNKL